MFSFGELMAAMLLVAGIAALFLWFGYRLASFKSPLPTLGEMGSKRQETAVPPTETPWAPPGIWVDPQNPTRGEFDEVFNIAK